MKYGPIDTEKTEESAPVEAIKPGDRWEFKGRLLQSVTVDLVGAIYVYVKVDEWTGVAGVTRSYPQSLEKSAFMDLTATGVKVA